MELSQLAIDIIGYVELVFVLVPFLLLLVLFCVWLVASALKTSLYQHEYFESLSKEEQELIRCYLNHKDYVFFKLDGHGKKLRNKSSKNENIEDK